MSFDVLKFVRSPGCDHGRNEESRNGRDIKIDIFDDYIRISERFRVIRVFSEVPGSYGNTRKKQWALMGHTGKERKASKGGRTPPHGLVRIGLGKGGAPFLLSPSPFPSPTPTRKGGVLLPVYTGAGGHTRDTTIDP